jgi:hypothetical protein
MENLPGQARLLRGERDFGCGFDQRGGLGRHHGPVREPCGAPRLRGRIALAAGPHKLVHQSVPGAAGVGVLVSEQQVRHRQRSYLRAPGRPRSRLAILTPVTQPPASEGKALDLLNELFKLIPATAGVMLALIWGLAGDKTPHDVLVLIRDASIILVVAIFFAFLGLQFVVSGLQRGATGISKDRLGSAASLSPGFSSSLAAGSSFGASSGFR